jgi:signal transduction histidine kinase
VDELQIGQVIQNITLNAKESMPGGGAIRVGVENVVLGPERVGALPKGKYVRLSIADNGFGILEETLPKVFEPYFTTKLRGVERGVGLGLTISHAIMQRHKGAITVESQVGEGSTFHLYFPVSPRA